MDQSAEGINAMVLKGRAIFRYYAVNIQGDLLRRPSAFGGLGTSDYW